MSILKLKVSFYFLLLLSIFLSEVGGECMLSVIDGGCPDEERCRVTCAPCYVGIGRVESFCDTHVELPFYLCTCIMSNGAPCNPQGPLPCPNNNNTPHPPSLLGQAEGGGTSLTSPNSNNTP